MKRFPLEDYAAKHFADHAEFGNVASQIANAIDELLDEDKPHFPTWMSHISSSWWAEKFSGQLKASPLYHVVDLGFCGLAQHLVLKRPQDVVIRGGIHGTPMHAALRRRHAQVCQLLLPYCIDLEIRDTNGETPLHVAVANGLLEVVQLIIGRGADINARDDNGWTPLHQIIHSSMAVTWRFCGFYWITART
jgi:ankyrin repeat protein